MTASELVLLSVLQPVEFWDLICAFGFLPKNYYFRQSIIQKIRKIELESYLLEIVAATFSGMR